MHSSQFIWNGFVRWMDIHMCFVYAICMEFFSSFFFLFVVGYFDGSLTKSTFFPISNSFRTIEMKRFMDCYFKPISNYMLYPYRNFQLMPSHRTTWATAVYYKIYTQRDYSRFCYEITRFFFEIYVKSVCIWNAENMRARGRMSEWSNLFDDIMEKFVFFFSSVVVLSHCVWVSVCLVLVVENGKTR